MYVRIIEFKGVLLEVILRGNLLLPVFVVTLYMENLEKKEMLFLGVRDSTVNYYNILS